VAVNSLAPVLGPSIGPIIGGWIAQKTTWRWGFWANTIANLFVQACAFIWLRETYAPRILGKRAKKLRQETGNIELHTKWDDSEHTLAHLWRKSFIRPWKLMFTQPIIQFLSLYNAYNYGLLYLFITTYGTLWRERYGETPGIAGLNYISLALGSLLVSQTCGPLNDKIYNHLKKRYGYAEDQEGVPEFRLPLMLVGAAITPIGLFWVCIV
jgi:MFS family permease